MKKCLCLLLATLMLLSLAACGDNSEVDSKGTQATSGDTTEADTQNMDFVCELPDNLNYGNETVNIIYADAVGRDDELVSEGGMGSGTVSEAVYERNDLVQKQLGVVLAMIPADGLSVASKVNADIESSSGDYDLVVNGTYLAITPATEGKYLDLNALDNIDTSKHYWTQGYNDMVTFTENNRQYLATGSLALSSFRLMYLTIYNKALFEDNQLADLYEVVKNGEWTLDYQYNIISGQYVDSDGDGKVSKGDSYGFVTGNCVSVDPYTVAGDVHMIIKDEDTRDLKFNSEALSPLSDLVDKVQKLLQDPGTYLFKTATEDDVGLNNIVETFAMGKSLMATLMFWNMEHNVEDLASMSYGIAPIPKYSEEQKEYHSYVQDQVSSFGISAAIGDEDRQEMLAAVLESLAYHSYNVVRPAYYNNTLSSRYMQDPNSAEILDLIFESLSFDFSSSCSNIITGCVIRDSLRDIYGSRTNTVSSSTKSWSRTVDRALQNINTRLNSLD